VIQKETAASLGAYLRFRHLVRNLYTWNFEAAKLANLVDRLSQTQTDLRADLVAFGSFLETASLADELGSEAEAPN
jgi:hypothetical protein